VRHRTGAVVAVVALLGTLVAPGPALAQDPVADREACADATDARFPDVPAGHTHHVGISCTAWWAVARGHADGTYRPEAPVTRAQMASFLTSLVLSTGRNLPVPATAFPDVAGVHRRPVERLAAAGIVTGRSDGTYRPDAPVTREQMATFLVRVVEYVSGEDLPVGDATFDDIADSAHRDNILRAAAAGLAYGDTSGAYRPALPVNRGQMGSFLARTLAHLVDGGVAVRAAARTIDRDALRPELCGAEFALGRAQALMDGRYQWSPHPEVRLSTSPTWTEDPLGDANWRFQFHSLRWLRALITATEFTDDPRYLDHATTLARDYVASNPRHAPRTAVAWSDHATAWRTISLGCLAMHLSPTPAWLTAAIADHRDTLIEPGFYVGSGNHALDQDTAVVAASCLTEQWDRRDLGVERIQRIVSREVDAQGLMNEQAVEYQDYNYERYTAAAAVIDACGVTRPAGMDRLPLMLDALTHMIQPDGTYVTLGDTDRRRAKMFDHDGIRWARTLGERGTPPTSTLAHYDAGFVFARTGWGTERPFVDEAMLTARFGPRPLLHGHDDHGSLTLFAGQQPMVVDPGKYAYGNTPERAHIVSREAHNVVLVGSCATVPDQPSSTSRVASDETTHRFTIHVRTCTGTSWTRSVVFVRDTGETIVLDRASGPADLPITQRWQLEVGARVETGTGRSLATWDGGASLLIEQLSPVRGVSSVAGSRSPWRGWVSLAYNDLTPAPDLAFVAPAGADATFTTVLRPGADGSSPAATARPSGDGVEVTIPRPDADPLVVVIR